MDIWKFLKALRFVDIVFFFAVLILMLLIITLFYFIKINNEEKQEENAKGVSDETMEMQIVKNLEENMKNPEPIVRFTNYEKDQEDRAIISYDELVDKSNKYELNYEKEEVIDDFSVKKVDLDNLVNKTSENVSNLEVRVISFAKEEAFLQALKQLQKELG